jgi:cbb3-type cytochrome oxidase subunit 3
MLVSIILFILQAATFGLVAGIACWAWSGKRKAEFERAANLPFEFDASPVDRSDDRHG